MAHRKASFAALTLALALPLLTACGFHLRGPQSLPFKTIYVGSPNSELSAALRRSIRTSGSTEVVDEPKEAEAVLTIVSEAKQKRILSLNAEGRVREFELRYTFAFRVNAKDGREIVPQNQILLTRDFSFNDSAVLAKEQEEALLYRDMQNDLVQQIMRRMAAANKVDL
ncbi:MAG: LPS assembly lipoprotein LptE [Rhodocyclaceae bacterium]